MHRDDISWWYIMLIYHDDVSWYIASWYLWVGRSCRGPTTTTTTRTTTTTTTTTSQHRAQTPLQHVQGLNSPFGHQPPPHSDNLAINMNRHPHSYQQVLGFMPSLTGIQTPASLGKGSGSSSPCGGHSCHAGTSGRATPIKWRLHLLSFNPHWSSSIKINKDVVTIVRRQPNSQ